MRLPEFNATQSLYKSRRHYRLKRSGESQAGAVVPAIPACRNCDDILERCDANGGFPLAVCRACLIGNCYSGVENPPPPSPGGLPGDWFPRWPRW